MIGAILRWLEAYHRRATLAYLARRGSRPDSLKEASRG